MVGGADRSVFRLRLFAAGTRVLKTCDSGFEHRGVHTTAAVVTFMKRRDSWSGLKWVGLAESSTTFCFAAGVALCFFMPGEAAACAPERFIEFL
jgi:hypothetical protein